MTHDTAIASRRERTRRERAERGTSRRQLAGNL